GGGHVLLTLGTITDDHNLVQCRPFLFESDIDGGPVVDVDFLCPISDESEYEHVVARGLQGVVTVGVCLSCSDLALHRNGHTSQSLVGGVVDYPATYLLLCLGRE